MSPGGGMSISRRSRPDEPPSSVSVTMAIGSTPATFRPRRTDGEAGAAAEADDARRGLTGRTPSSASRRRLHGEAVRRRSSPMLPSDAITRWYGTMTSSVPRAHTLPAARAARSAAGALGQLAVGDGLAVGHAAHLLDNGGLERRRAEPSSVGREVEVEERVARAAEVGHAGGRRARAPRRSARPRPAARPAAGAAGRGRSARRGRRPARPTPQAGHLVGDRRRARAPWSPSLSPSGAGGRRSRARSASAGRGRPRAPRRRRRGSRSASGSARSSACLRAGPTPGSASNSECSPRGCGAAVVREREAVRLVADAAQQQQPGVVVRRARSAPAGRARRSPPAAWPGRSRPRAATSCSAIAASAALSWPLPPSMTTRSGRGRERRVVLRSPLASRAKRREIGLGHGREVVRPAVPLDAEDAVVGLLRHPVLEDDHRGHRRGAHRVGDVVALDARRQRPRGSAPRAAPPAPRAAAIARARRPAPGAGRGRRCAARARSAAASRRAAPSGSRRASRAAPTAAPRAPRDPPARRRPRSAAAPTPRRCRSARRRTPRPGRRASRRPRSPA